MLKEIKRIFGIETRSTGSAEDQVDRAEARASGIVPHARETAIASTCRALWSNAFAAARVRGTHLLSPSLLAGVGSSLFDRGEAVALIQLRDGAVYLEPVADWDVVGSGSAEAGWTYRCHLAGPSGNVMVNESAAGVLHFRINSTPSATLEGNWRI